MKILEKLLDISFVISLVLLGKFNLESLELSKYQIVVTVFWATGILKFKNPNNNIKESVLDSIKDLIISISVIPLWYWISGRIENELFEPVTIVAHFTSLMVILYLTQKSAKLSCAIAYYTHAVIPIIAFICIRVGMPIELSVIIAVIVPEPINYCYYKKQRANRAQEK